jgi:hypothetical protein
VTDLRSLQNTEIVYLANSPDIEVDFTSDTLTEKDEFELDFLFKDIKEGTERDLEFH